MRCRLWIHSGGSRPDASSIEDARRFYRQFLLLHAQKEERARTQRHHHEDEEEEDEEKKKTTTTRQTGREESSSRSSPSIVFIPPFPEEFPTSAILGCVTLVDCIAKTGARRSEEGKADEREEKEEEAQPDEDTLLSSIVRKSERNKERHGSSHCVSERVVIVVSFRCVVYIHSSCLFFRSLLRFSLSFFFLGRPLTLFFRRIRCASQASPNSSFSLSSSSSRRRGVPTRPRHRHRTLARAREKEGAQNVHFDPTRPLQRRAYSFVPRRVSEVYVHSAHLFCFGH